MSRDALIVGISSYQYVGLSKLDAPSLDAEEIAKQLESSLSSFSVTRLPAIKAKENNTLKVGKKTGVTINELKKALIKLFNPSGEYYPDTALFYFSGHGLYDESMQKGYLATSDVNPDANNWGFPLTDLRDLLQKSPVRKQIIWLDCCHSGNLFSINEANPGEKSGYSRCFIAGSREYESTYELASGEHGVLTEALLQGLNPERSPEQWISTLALSAHIDTYLKKNRKTYPQQCLFLNVGESIDLTRSENPFASQVIESSLDVDTCPYKALDAFDFNETDAKLFCGRTVLTDELLGKIYDGNFLIVLGASGSGKSSVVRAGLLIELKKGIRRSGTDTWKILPVIQPGENPLQSLTSAFVEVEREGNTVNGVEALITLVGLVSEDEQPVVLVIDQFEEVFTLCKGNPEKEQERIQFFEYLFGAVDNLAGKLRLVAIMRADFMGKCLEQPYGELAERLKSCRVDITPMSKAELEEAIVNPSRLAGLKVAPELVERIISSVWESPGSLPLLQYALTELWKDWHQRYQLGGKAASKELTLNSYLNIAGVEGALEKQANKVYNRFEGSPVKQGLVKRIFLELVQLGEEAEDTRRRIRKSNLYTNIHPELLVDEILKELVKARLVVMDELKLGELNQTESIIDLAHEATIRHWKMLRQWLDENRIALPLIRKLRVDASRWKIASYSRTKYLLRGIGLEEAEELLEKYREIGYFDQQTEEFILQSKEAAIQADLLANHYRPHEEALRAWTRSEKTDESCLLRGFRLAEAKEWAEKQIELSKLDQDFLEASSEHERVERERHILARAIDADRLENLSQELEKSLAAERRQLEAAEMGKMNEKIAALTISSELLYLSNQHIEAMIAGVINGVQIKRLTTEVDKITLEHLRANTLIRAITALEQIIYGTHEYNRLEGHGYFVNKVCYSRDGQFIGSASSDFTIKIWKVSGVLLQTLKGHKNWVTSINFSPDGNLLVSGSRDNTIKLWQRDPSTGDFSLKCTLEEHKGPVLDVCFSHDGEMIASASEDTTVRLWKSDGTLLRALGVVEGHKSWVTCVAFHPNSKSLVSGSADHSLIIWDILGEKRNKLNGHKSFVESVAYSSNGSMIVSGSRDHTVKIWRSDASDPSLIKSFDHTDKIRSVAFSPDNNTIASSGFDRKIRVWDIEQGLQYVFQGHGDVVNSIAFSPDGKNIASASSDTTVKLWSIRGTPLSTWMGHSDAILSIAISPDSKVLASACKDKTVNLWNMNGTLEAILEGHTNQVNYVTFSPDSSTLLTASADSNIKMWQSDGTLIDTISAHREEIHKVVYRCDGEVFASCSADRTVRVWSADGKWLQTMQHSAEVYSIDFSPDGSMIASASKDKLIYLWSWDGNLLRTLEGHSAEVYTVCFNHDGTMIASGSKDQSIKLWKIEENNFQLIKTLNGHSAEVTSVCFSPDGKSIISASVDSTIQVWSIDGTLLRTFNGHQGAVRTVCFSPNGKILISAGKDCKIIMWNLNLDNLLVRGCQWLQEYLKNNKNVSEEDKRNCLGGSSWLFRHLKSNPLS